LPVPTPLQEGITFDEVSFRYPGQEAWVLDRFSVQLPAGKIIAIVGENGAGKSTLIKLLARFFDPLEGRVSADGVDLQEMDPAVWQRQITLMFQNSVQYAATAADNIAYSDWQQEPSQEAIENAAVAAGADEPIMSLPLGYENLLGKWLGGADLSTGEWQRLALARAFLRQASIVVLDEPTSAMDSWAELDWLARFQSLVAGRTVLIITHRFTTAMYADIIHVMHEGEMVESGSHEALLAANGRYAQSWHAQMERQSQKISLA
jgi:ATP-binding cassette subfamily B protein